MSDNHTPLPWGLRTKMAEHLSPPAFVAYIEEQSFLDGNGYRGGIASLQGYPSGGSATQSNDECKANAAFIVKACNSYYEREALIADLKEYAQTIRVFGKTDFNEKTWADLQERMEAIL